MHKDIRTAVLASQTVGHAGFPALLMDRGLISRNDLVVARQHAQREGIELADAFVALGLVPEAECYAALAEAAGLNMVDAVEMAKSELAIRLVPSGSRGATSSCRSAWTTRRSHTRPAGRSIPRSSVTCRLPPAGG